MRDCTVDTGLYQLPENGRAYLEGELDVDDLECGE